MNRTHRLPPLWSRSRPWPARWPRPAAGDSPKRFLLVASHLAFGGEDRSAKLRIFLEERASSRASNRIQVFRRIANGATPFHLGQRDCSVQLGKSEVIEEAPSPSRFARTVAPAHGPATRVAAVKAIRYELRSLSNFSARPRRHYFFMEMNPGLMSSKPSDGSDHRSRPCRPAVAHRFLRGRCRSSMPTDVIGPRASLGASATIGSHIAIVPAFAA